MKRLLRDRDFLVGIIFFAVAAVFLRECLSLRLGRAVEMGPGYVPTLIAVLLMVLSVGLIAKSIVSPGGRLDGLELGPIGLVAAAVLLFGVLIRPAGLIPATLALVLVASFAAQDVRWKETILVSIGLSVFADILFVKLLKLPLGF